MFRPVRLILQESAADLVIGRVGVQGKPSVSTGQREDWWIEKLLAKFLKRLELLGRELSELRTFSLTKQLVQRVCYFGKPRYEASVNVAQPQERA